MPKGYTTPREVKCAGCSVIFIATGSRSKWCSRKCMDAKIWRDKHRKTVICRVCRQTVDRPYSREYCSRKCSGRAWRLWRYYRITIDRFEELVREQDGKCAVCHTPTTDWHIDHDHACCPVERNTEICGKCVRGLLCNNCNGGLGRFKDDPERLRRAADYLERYARNVV